MVDFQGGNSCIGKKCRNGVPAFKEVAERCSGAFRHVLSTELDQMFSRISQAFRFQMAKIA